MVFRKGDKGYWLGKKRSEETIRKMSLSTIGKHYSPSTEFKKGNKFSIESELKRRHSISKALKGNKLSEETKKKISINHLGKNPWNKGKKGLQTHTMEWKENMRKISIGRPHISENAKRKLSKLLKIRRKIMIFPLQDTKIEIKIQNFLQQLGIEHYTHRYMNEIEHSYQCDIFVPSMNMVIECDGDYWHGNPIKYQQPNKMQIEQIEEDKIRTQELQNVGYKVIRLWESEIKMMKFDDFKRKIDILFEERNDNKNK